MHHNTLQTTINKQEPTNTHHSTIQTSNLLATVAAMAKPYNAQELAAKTAPRRAPAAGIPAPRTPDGHPQRGHPAAKKASAPKSARARGSVQLMQPTPKSRPQD